MIQIRLMKKDDQKSILQILKENNIAFEDFDLEPANCFVVEDGGHLCGLATYILTDEDKAKLNYLYIRKEDRGFKLGDGLLRAVFNHLDHQKIKKVYVQSDEKTNGFFMAEGLEIVMSEPDNSNKLTFKAELPDFFLKPCKSSRGNA